MNRAVERLESYTLPNHPWLKLFCTGIVPPRVDPDEESKNRVMIRALSEPQTRYRMTDILYG